MILCLTKHMRITMNNTAFTLVELMMAVAFSALLMIGVFGFYTVSSQTYSAGISGQTLQDAANVVLSKIIEGETESGTVYRLATAVSYMIPNGSANELYRCGGPAQGTPCNTSNAFSELYYCQDSPCGGSSDVTARWYYLNSTSTGVIYHHPTSSGTVDENIYTAPTGSTLTLRFSPATTNTAFDVEIDVALIKILSSNITNKRLATTGASSTFVLLRDHP